MKQEFRVGLAFPQTEIGDDPYVIRDFVQAVEAMGFKDLMAYDHVVGADPEKHPGWSGIYDVDDTFHEPLTLFSYLAGLTTEICFMSGVIVLPQRQTVLFAKQSANVDVFSAGRLKVGVGVGWNAIEYEALGVDFSARGRLLDEQIGLLRRLWTERSITEDSKYHRITGAGIKPLPVQRPIPIYIGAIAPVAVARAAKYGDGWISTVAAADAASAVSRFQDLVRENGRNPADVRIVSNTHFGTTLGGKAHDPDEAAECIATWQAAGADGIIIDITNLGLDTPDRHLEFLRRLAPSLTPSMVS